MAGEERKCIMTATEQEMMERAEAIRTVKELRAACAEFGVEMTPEEEDAFMAMKASGGELSDKELDATVGGRGVHSPYSGRLIVTAFYKCDRITPGANNCVSCDYSKYSFPYRYCMIK